MKKIVDNLMTKFGTKAELIRQVEISLEDLTKDCTGVSNIHQIEHFVKVIKYVNKNLVNTK